MFFQKGQPGPSKYTTGSRYTSSFPKLTAEFTQLLADESYLLNTLHFIRKHGAAGAERVTQLALKKKGTYLSVNMSDEKPGVSRAAFTINGLSAIEGEIIRLSEDNSVSRGVIWSYRPVWEKNPSAIIPFNYFDGFLEKKVAPAKNITFSYHIRGGLSWVKLLPLRVNAGMGVLTEVAEGKLSRGTWGIGLDCQLRNSFLDLTGGRTYINTVIKYSCPQYSVSWNMQEAGERYVTSIVTRPGLADSFAENSVPRKLLQGWRIGGEVDTILSNGALQLNRVTVGAEKEIEADSNNNTDNNVNNNNNKAKTTMKGKIDFINGISQSYNVSLSINRIFPASSSSSNSWGLGLAAQTSLMASGVRPGPAKSLQFGFRFEWK